RLRLAAVLLRSGTEEACAGAGIWRRWQGRGRVRAEARAGGGFSGSLGAERSFDLRRQVLLRRLSGRRLWGVSRLVEPRARAAGRLQYRLSAAQGWQSSGRFHCLRDGFAGAVKEPGRAAFRPSGLAMGPDGALYISEDTHGRIW